MSKNILEQLKSEFSLIGSDIISGDEAVDILESVIRRLAAPKEVVQAQKYITECSRDLGFLGSPEYDRSKKIVDSYYKSIKDAEKEGKEKAEYLRLKIKYEDS